MGEAIDQVGHRLVPLREERLGVGVLGTQRIEVDVAVAHMAVDHHAGIGHQFQHAARRLVDEARDARQRHRHIALDAAAGARLRVRDFLADAPEGLRVGDAGGDRRVPHQFLFVAALENFEQRRFKAGGIRARAQFDQHHPVVPLRQRRSDIAQIVEHQVQRRARDQLERRDGAARQPLGFAQQAHGRVRRRHRDEGYRARARLRHQLEHRGGDDAQRSFGADEQVFQVVAGVVLAQAPQRRVDAPIGQHRLDAEHQVPHIAVAQHRGTAGIGRQIAPDLARAFGADAQRKQASGFFRRGACGGQRHAGLHGQRVVDRIDRQHLVHAAQVQHHGIAARVRHRAAHQRGIAALRHHRHAVRMAPRDHRGDLLGGRRQHHHAGLAAADAPVVGDVGLGIGVGDQAGVVADDGLHGAQRGVARGTIQWHGRRNRQSVQ